AAPEGAHLQVLRPGTGHEVLGTAGVGWRRMRAGARTLRGGLLADMAVLPGHRTLGPAMQLQRAASDRALAEGDLVYGFPNANAVPVVKRLGYVHLGDMVLYVRALRHAPYLERRLPRPLATLLGRAIDTAFALRDRLRNLHRGALHAQWSEGPLDLVHPRWPRPGMLEGVRDRAALEWRFAHNPLAAAGQARRVARQGRARMSLRPQPAGRLPLPVSAPRTRRAAHGLVRMPPRRRRAAHRRFRLRPGRPGGPLRRDPGARGDRPGR